MSKTQSWQRADGLIDKVALLEFKLGRHGNHGRIIGAVLEAWDKDLPALLLPQLIEGRTQPPVR